MPKPPKPPTTTVTATITLDDPTPTQGEKANFVVDLSEPASSYVEGKIAQNNSYSVFGWVKQDAQHYTVPIGLYAPNWPDHTGGTLTANVHLYVYGDSKRDPIIGTLTVDIAP